MSTRNISQILDQVSSMDQVFYQAMIISSQTVPVMVISADNGNGPMESHGTI